MGKELNLNHISEIYCPQEILLEGHIKSTIYISLYSKLVVYDYRGHIELPVIIHHIFVFSKGNRLETTDLVFLVVKFITWIRN